MRWTCHTLYQFLDLEKMQSNRSVGFKNKIIYFLFFPPFFFFLKERLLLKPKVWAPVSKCAVNGHIA